MNQLEDLSKPSVPVQNKPLYDGSNSAIYRDDIYSLQTIPVKDEEIEKLEMGKRQKKLFLDRAGIHGPESPFLGIRTNSDRVVRGLSGPLIPWTGQELF